MNFDKKLAYDCNLKALKQKQQSLDTSIPIKFLTNISQESPLANPRPNISSFLSPGKSPINQINDQKLIEESIFRIKPIEKRASKPEIRTSKSKILANPATREDVEALGHWLDKMIGQLINEKNLGLDSLFENLQLVYLGCFQELIRQISIDCFERGQLIQRIWNAYINLFERAIIEQSRGISQVEMDYLKENTRLHKLYQKEMEKLKQNLMKTTQEKNIFEVDMGKLNENFKYIKKKNVQLEKDCLFFRTNFENMRTEYNLISEDNICLKTLIERNFQKETQINEEVEHILRRLPKREKKISAIQYNRKKTVPLNSEKSKELLDENELNNEKKEPNNEKNELNNEKNEPNNEKNEYENVKHEKIENAENAENAENDENDKNNQSFFIEEKAVDTNDLFLYEDKNTDTADLLKDFHDKNEVIGYLDQESDRNKTSEALESPRLMLENDILEKKCPRLSKMMISDEIALDLREEIERVRRMLIGFQEEIQDLRISMQEKENRIEGFVDKETKNEQEMAILSDEVINFNFMRLSVF